MLKIKTFVKLDDGNMRTIDTIQHEGGLWLLDPYGSQPPDPQMYKPARNDSDGYTDSPPGR